MDIRTSLAKSHMSNNVVLRPMKFIDGYINAYRKGLQHDMDGFVDIKIMDKLIEALESRDSNKL